MKLRLQKYSYQFAEQVLDSRLAIKEEIENGANGLTAFPSSSIV